MKPTTIMADDVMDVDRAHKRLSDPAQTGNGAEIFKTGDSGRLDANWNEGWSSCSLPCCESVNTLCSVQTNSENSCTNSEKMNSQKSDEEKQKVEIDGTEPSLVNDNRKSNEKCQDEKYLGSVAMANGDLVTRKNEREKKPTPVKLMRTPTLVVKKRNMGKVGTMDKEMEELEMHFMNTTLKTIKFLPGPKFTIFNDVAFQRECLEAHNKVRQVFGCPPLCWCQELADEAEIWAQTVVERGRILYKEMAGVGENISMLSANGSNHLPTGSEITELWSSEIQHYNYSKPGWSERCQHFTQLIWKRTTEFCVARAWLPSKSLIAIVAFYAPSGNCNGLNEFKENVPQLPTGKMMPVLVRK